MSVKNTLKAVSYQVQGNKYPVCVCEFFFKFLGDLGVRWQRKSQQDKLVNQRSKMHYYASFFNSV